MAATFSEIITDCVQQALGLPRDQLEVELRDLALSAMNEQGRIIWDSWPWDNEKLDEFDSPTPDADGIITFAANVDVVRALRSLDSSSSADSGQRIYAESDLLAMERGVDISDTRFKHLSADTNGYRRIQVPVETTYPTYRVLALKHWSDAVVDANYDPLDPSATPTDYRVLTFIIDRAEPALRAYVKDVLREYDDRPQLKNAERLLGMAINRDIKDTDREKRLNPRNPCFTEIGNWH